MSPPGGHARRRLLLLGGGHSHLPVLVAAGDWPEGIEVTLVSPDVSTAYSGMVPGVIAGHYATDDCLIDVARLAARSRVRFVRASAVAVDPARRTVRLDNGAVLEYDLLSLDVGATPRLPGMLDVAIREGRCGATTLAPSKPFPLLIERFDRFIAGLDSSRSAVQMYVVGAGIAGVEVALALAHRMRGHPGARVSLLSGDERLLPAAPRRVGAALERACADIGVGIVPDTRITSVQASGMLMTADGRGFAGHFALFATGAGAPAWLSTSGLALDAAGFVAVDATLASRSHADVFATGDCATVIEHPRPKAGVYAVRQGTPLAQNLHRVLSGEAPLPFIPQREALALVALGPRAAMAVRNGIAAGGPASKAYLGNWLAARAAALLWRWKDRIDRRFVGRF